MDIQRQDLGDNIAAISVTLNSADYKPKFESEVNRQAQKATIKGFRKGKTPPSFIKKMYGESILAEMIDKMLYEKLTDYIKEQNIKTLAQPILSKDTHIHLDTNDLTKDYTAKFEIGVIPDYEIKGIDSTYEYEYFTNEASEEEIQTQVNDYAKNFGSLQDVDNVNDKDTIYATATQLENGEIKPEGFSRDIVISLNRLNSEELRRTLLSKTIGDTFIAKITDLEKGDINLIKKYVLGLGDEVEINENDQIQLTIKNIKRMVPAEITDEFLKERFNISSTEEFREILKGNINSNKTAAAKALLQVKIKNKIMEETKMVLSENFARKWLKEVEKLDDEKIEKEINNFIIDLKWNYISDELCQQNGIKVTEQDLRTKIDANIFSYEMRYGQLSDKEYKKVFEQTISNRDQLYRISEDIKTEKLFDVLIQKVNKKEIPLNAEEFKLKIDELNKK
jgi:trigger factor